MSLLSYLYQLKRKLNESVLTSNTADNKKKSLNNKLTDSCCEEKHVNDEIRITCKRLAKNIQYMNNLTHWPITEIQDKSIANTLIYLNKNKKNSGQESQPKSNIPSSQEPESNITSITEERTDNNQRKSN